MSVTGNSARLQFIREQFAAAEPLLFLRQKDLAKYCTQVKLELVPNFYVLKSPFTKSTWDVLKCLVYLRAKEAKPGLGSTPGREVFVHELGQH